MNDFRARSLLSSSARSSALLLGAAFLAVSGYARAEPAPATSAPAAEPAPSAAAASSSETSPAVTAVPPAATAPNATARPPHPSKRALPDEPLHPDDGQMGTHQEHWLFGIGLRESFVAHSGFDPFSTNNVLPQFSVDAGRVLFASGQLSFAALALFDYGSVKASARGLNTSLSVSRVTAAAEGRYHFWRRFYLFGRVAPGALYSGAMLSDPIAGGEQHSNSWAFATDLSLGAALEFAGEARGASNRPRGWIGLDGGYGWAQASKLAFKSSEGDANAPARLEPVELGELAVRGGFFRVNGTITF